VHDPDRTAVVTAESIDVRDHEDVIREFPNLDLESARFVEVDPSAGAEGLIGHLLADHPRTGMRRHRSGRSTKRQRLRLL
jgi:hypothetical protein